MRDGQEWVLRRLGLQMRRPSLQWKTRSAEDAPAAGLRVTHGPAGLVAAAAGLVLQRVGELLLGAVEIAVLGSTLQCADHVVVVTGVLRQRTHLFRRFGRVVQFHSCRYTLARTFDINMEQYGKANIYYNWLVIVRQAVIVQIQGFLCRSVQMR